MSQSSTQTSPTKNSPSKSTTTAPNTTENLSETQPQTSDVITDATPLTMIHPSFNTIRNPTPSNPSSSPKSNTKKRTKSTTTRKPKTQKSKSRYSSDFNMQQLYLSDLGNTNPNVAPNASAPIPDVPIEANKGESAQTLSSEKRESTVVDERVVPNTPSDEGDNEDAEKIQIAEEALNSLVESISGTKAVPDALASLAQDQPQETADDVVVGSNVPQDGDATVDVTKDQTAQPDDDVADAPTQHQTTVTGEIHTDNAMSDHVDNVTDAEKEGANDDNSTDEDVTIMKIVGESRRKAGKTGMGSRLRARKDKEPEIVAEAPKSTKKKKNVAAEATKSPKKKKLAAEATTSTKKKKMYGPLRRSSRVEIPAKQKQQGSKRKTINLSDSETDAEENAPPISTASTQKTPKKRKIAPTVSAEDAVAKAPGILSTQKKKAGRSIPQNIPDVPMDNVSFHFSNSAAKWKFVYHRRLALERELSDEALECKEVMDLILQAGLMKTVSGIGRCYEKLVKEFIVNIGEDCDNKLSKEYHQVFVRGKCVQFSPAVINDYLGRREYGYPGFEPTNNQVCKAITADQVKVWPLKGKVPSVMLSVKYAILNRIGAVNWVPTSHTSTIATGLAKFIYAIGTGANVDYGSLIFDQIVEHGKSWAIKLAVSFPTLICEIILDQHPNILVPEDVPCKREPPMTLSYKLFEGKHAADITVPTKKVTPVEPVASTSMTRKTMILTMEATVRALDEQKSELEKVIAALKKEEAEEEGLVAENASDNVAGDGVDAAVGDAADHNVDKEEGDTEELELSDSSASV
ncbi:bromodomain-containing protein [Trifolium repens]|nr:bromodomain-containing protein [Trifolium repens]KAK2399146.1 bromodomain-containing protein [Trifolium repens]